MKLSIFTTISDYNNNHWKESLQSYLDLADEVVVVDGNGDEGMARFVGNELFETEGHINTGSGLGFWKDNKKLVFYHYKWPEEFEFNFIGEQFQRGYEACTGDWVIRADIDFVFHEQDFETIRETLERYNDLPAMSLLKWQFILPDRYNLKSRTVVAVNKAMYGSRIKFDSGGDLCQPSLDGKQIIEPPCITVPIYNYEHLLKTEEVLKKEIGRMERAYRKTFKKNLYGDDYWTGWLQMVRGRLNKHGSPIELKKHPKYIQETIKNLKRDQFGYDNFGGNKCTYF